MATGARRSEIHALSRTHKFKLECGNSGPQTLRLHTYPGFLAKNARPGANRDPIVIPSMAHMYGAGDLERNLCPVRAVTKYLARAKDGRWKKADHKLIRHPNPDRSTSTNNISMWIRNAVVLTHEAAGQELPETAKAHEVRAIVILSNKIILTNSRHVDLCGCHKMASILDIPLFFSHL